VSSFICKHCGQEIIDSESGYRTGCEHYPLEEKSDIPYTRIMYDNKEIGGMIYGSIIDEEEETN